jgi:hypothetical protein
MGFPLQNPLNSLEFNADFVRASQAPQGDNEPAGAGGCVEEAVDDDLQRLESSLQWVKSELSIAALETGAYAKNHPRGLPRAHQLPPVPGLAPVNTERTGAGPRRVALPLELAPPLPSERLPLPAQRNEHADTLRGALCILIASAVAGSIAYHISAEGFLSASQPAQAAPSGTIMSVGISNQLH